MRVLKILFLIVTLAISVMADTPANNWAQFRGNHALTGVSQSNVPTSLKPLWTFEAGESIESSAAIVGGTVYVGSQKGELVALSLDNGSVYWKYSTGSPIGESSPAYSGGGLYTGHVRGGVNRLKADGMAFIAGCDEVFRAIRISDGKELFNVSSGAYTGASPALRGGSAFYGTFDNEVLGVNLAERKIAWRYEHPQRKFPFYSSAAVTSTRVVLGGRDKMVHGLTLAGKAAWTFTTRARVESSPAIAGGRVFVGSNDGRFYVLSLTNGAKVWEFNAGAPLSASPAIANGRIVIGSQDGRLY